VWAREMSLHFFQAVRVYVYLSKQLFPRVLAHTISLYDYGKKTDAASESSTIKHQLFDVILCF